MSKIQEVQEALDTLLSLLRDDEAPVPTDLRSMRETLLSKRDALLSLVKQEGTPCYVVDYPELRAAVQRYMSAFEEHLPGSTHYYAVKLNHHPLILNEVVRLGMKLDVSSRRELELALQTEVDEIVFSGPGKTVSDLELVFTSDRSIIVHLDSIHELSLLNEMACARNRRVAAGVRVFADHFGTWGKFGIPLSEMASFLRHASELPGVSVEGIQFHLSWNANAEPYRRMIRALARTLNEECSPEVRASLKFIDLGGGFRPHETEGVYPWKIPSGEVQKIVQQVMGTTSKPLPIRYAMESVPIETYAQGIAEEIEQSLAPLGDFHYFTEPGRVIANNAMHVLISIVDRKRDDCAIADGGINLVGWERFEHDYFPLLNLTHPSLEDSVSCTVYGSLCMPQDLWGYAVYGTSLHRGDVILVPYQGALTYSLAQEFIKPIAPVFSIDNMTGEDSSVSEN